ncbi:MAG: M67 family metallopeptidase [Planctomycetota bacterium]|nr:M67 family metallopeptidase [Planctomycetota bacterium]
MNTPSAPLLRLPATLRARLEDWSRVRYPREACGLLIGLRAEKHIEVVQVREARNRDLEHAALRYLLDPVDHLAAEEDAAANGFEVVGIWHSHPDHPACPSELDREQAWAGWSYVILAVEHGRTSDLRSWRLVGERFEEERLSS